MDSSDLASLDVLGTGDELRARAREEDRGRRGEIGFDAVGEVEGRDDSRAVTVRIDRGGQVSDVLISSWWRDDLSPLGLGEALLAAYRSALSQAASAVGRSILDPTAGRRQSPASEESAADLNDGAWLENIRHRLDRAQAHLEQVDRLGRDNSAERTVTGPGGHVRLVVHGDTVSRVKVDVHTALQQSPNSLAADALEAFRAVRPKRN